MKIKKIEWSKESPSNNECCYDHVKGSSPLGEYLITWKSWKEHDSYCVESPLGWIGSGVDLDDAKEIAQGKFDEIILSCIQSE